MSNAAPSNNGGAISLAASPRYLILIEFMIFFPCLELQILDSIYHFSRGAKRTSSGSQIKKPPVEATAWCYTGTKEDTNFSFAWTIENFGRKMEIYKNGECLTSDTFKVEVEGVETAWKLECFPNGKQKIGEVHTTLSFLQFSVFMTYMFKGYCWGCVSLPVPSQWSRYQPTIQLRYRVRFSIHYHQD